MPFKLSLPKITVIILFFASFLLAIYPLLTQFYFYYDQARDAFEAYAIWNFDHVKLFGPATDIPGLYHGVLWYYLLAPLYALGHNDPQIVGLIMFPAFFVSAFFCYLLTKKLTGNMLTATIASVFYVFSPLFQLTSRWLSNPSPVLILTPILLWLLLIYIEEKKKWALFSAGILMGFIIQFELGFLFLAISIPIYFVYYRLKLLNIFYFFAGLAIALSSFLVSEAHFHFRGVTGIISYFESSNHHWTLVSFFQNVLEKMSSFLLVTFSSVPSIIALTIFLILIASAAIAVKKKTRGLPFLLIWMVSLIPYLFMSSGFTNSLFLFLPYVLPGIIITTIVVISQIKSKPLLAGLVIILLILQTWSDFEYIEKQTMPLTVQHGMTLQDEEKIVDYTYKRSNNKPFTINSLTSPLYINTTWAYLYQFYGLPKYHSLPFWDGRSQDGILGNLTFKKHATDKRFLILEPTEGISDFFIKDAIDAENGQSKIINQTEIGKITVQERELLKR